MNECADEWINEWSEYKNLWPNERIQIERKIYQLPTNNYRRKINAYNSTLAKLNERIINQYSLQLFPWTSENRHYLKLHDLQWMSLTGGVHKGSYWAIDMVEKERER